MWLGLSAVATALIFALVKFFSSLHMRRLRERHMRLAQEIKRERSRKHTLDGKLQVETSRRGAAENKLATARRYKDDLYGRLRVELPETMQAELRSCIDRHPVPEPSGVRVAHQLGLTERITQALGQLSILVIEFPTAGADELLDGLVSQLQEAELKYSLPDEGDDTCFLTTAFDQPDDAITFVRQVLGAHEIERLSGIRGMLLAGLSVTDLDSDNVNQLFARTLHGARTILESAPKEGLLIDGNAYEHVTGRVGLELHSRAENLWHLAWEHLSVPDWPGHTCPCQMTDDETDEKTAPASEADTTTRDAADADATGLEEK